MVDINLIGNEKSEPSQEKERDFSSSAGFDTDELVSGDLGSYDSGPGERDGGYLDSSYVKKSPKTLMYILIGGCCVLLVLLILLLASDSGKKDDEVVQDAGKTTKTTPTAEETKSPQALATGINQDKIVNVSRLISILPDDLQLSVLRYSHGTFILESRSKSSDPVSTFRNQFRQAFPTGTIKELNTEAKRIRGISFQQGVVSGAVTENDIWSQPDLLTQLNYISENEIQTQVRSNCARAGLALKRVDVGKGSTENNFRKNLIKVSAIGDRDAAIKFLEGLNSQKLNLNLSKIVMVASNFQNFNDKNVNLFVDMELFAKL
ncbi:hypothetical protein JXJ21_24500 [candidate division KSB1 bacterium]|nr:hypothetical protein [candidate division KSB1 bacterium]